jgi:hypothetical protein
MTGKISLEKNETRRTTVPGVISSVATLRLKNFGNQFSFI